MKNMLSVGKFYPLTKKREFHPKTDTPLAELYDTTQKNRMYLEEECDVRVVEMWECEWKNIKKTELAIRAYVDVSSIA